jgi:hypothetical protein
MNIFYLSDDPQLCAEQHCDKHVVKMCIEYAQLLSTAHRVLDGTEYTVIQNGRRIKRWRLGFDFMDKNLMLASHINHPSNIWARENHRNYRWLFMLLKFLLKEYTHRYGKTHAVERRLDYLNLFPTNIDENGTGTPMPQCMPDDCKVEHMPILAYQNFYMKHKRPFCNWTKRPRPIWFT